jgi:hypothetical protein
VPVAHSYNPSYSGGRDQEDCSLKPAWANSSARPYLKKPFSKIGLVEWLKVNALSSSPSTTKKETINNIYYLSPLLFVLHSGWYLVFKYHNFL